MRMIAICLMLGLAGAASAQETACDWEILSDSIEPMTDLRRCVIQSPAANLGVVVRDGQVMLLTTSAYKDGRDGLEVRIDDNEAIYIGRDRSTGSYGDATRQALREIRQGERLRVSYRDYPSSKAGDAPICTLPALIDSCL